MSNLFNKLKSIKKKYIIITIIIIIIIITSGVLAWYFTKQSSSSSSSSTSVDSGSSNEYVPTNIISLTSILQQNPVSSPIITGYWNWTWSGDGAGNPTDASAFTIGILFGGESAPAAITNNINDSYKIKAQNKYINLGGGLETGKWNHSDFAIINSQLANIKNKGWDGICFDIEVCSQDVTVNDFSDCFAKCKQAGLSVLVTMSHLSPYECTSVGQGSDFVNSWIQDTNIDYISPQLYGPAGNVLEPSDLSIFKSIESKIIPSIPTITDWENIKNLGINPAGYLLWTHDNTDLSANNNICGSDWSSAQKSCASGKPIMCPDNKCPSGQSCYAFPCYTPNKCGIDYSHAVANCAKNRNCPGGNDSECPSNQKCFKIPKTCA